MGATDMLLAGVEMETPGYRWFSGNGCVAEMGERREVYVGGTLVCSFDRHERGPRNLVLVALASDPSTHLGQLAEAFDVSTETIRLLRIEHRDKGVQAIWDRIQSGRPPKVTDAQRKKLEKMFDEGVSIREAQARLGKLSKGTVGRIHLAWSAARTQAQTRNAGPGQPTVEQPELPLTGELKGTSTDEENDTSTADETAVDQEDNTSMPGRASDSTDERSDETPTAAAPEEEGRSSTKNIMPAKVMSGRAVQHVGTWLMLACLERCGLYRRAAEIGVELPRRIRSAVRVALDAVVMALSIGQRCVEGVRRLMTPTAARLLRAEHAPSANWVRRVLGSFSRDLGGARLHLGMAAEYIDAARRQSEGAVVFYVDNHLRPYSGERVLRKGWRMQDRRVLPGATDYYVHDEDGRPVLRLDVPSHDSLTNWLGPITHLLRRALPNDRILVAFDRAGAFPEELAALRNDGFEFVTYERRPYPTAAQSALDQTVETPEGKLRFGEARINLRQGRGRLRRISVRDADDRQINLLAASEESAARLIEIMRGRWRQENGFKHGVERWGINQLDGRQTVAYSPETVVPNPARRRLDRALRIAAIREGDARRELAKLGRSDPRRTQLAQEIREAIAEQEEIVALRPSTPKHAPLKDTELAGKLEHHTSEYKATLDAIRIACANAETDLAGELALHLKRPAEAKKALANLFAAPGHIDVSDRQIRVTLLPAGNRSEQAAYAAMLDTVSSWQLALPGDPARRPLVFRSPIS